MSKYDWLLVFHLFGAAALVGGALAFHTLQIALIRSDRPRRIATLFGIGRPFELAIQIGAVVSLAFGIWLAYADHEIPKYKITDGWIIAAIVLWFVANGLGFRGGEIYARARELAVKLAAEGDEPSPELSAMIRSRPAAILTWASTASMFAIIVLMVWKPGAP